MCLLEIDFTHPNDLEFRTARVIGNGKTQSESLDLATTSFPQYDEIGHFYTGELTMTYLRPAVIIDDETRDAFRPDKPARAYMVLASISQQCAGMRLVDRGGLGRAELAGAELTDDLGAVARRDRRPTCRCRRGAVGASGPWRGPGSRPGEAVVVTDR